MLLVLAIAALGFVGQPSLASDRATAPGCAAMVSHFEISSTIGAGKIQDVVSGAHAAHSFACPMLGCLSIHLGEGDPPSARVSVETAVISNLGRAERSGLAVSPGYRPPIAV